VLGEAGVELSSHQKGWPYEGRFCELSEAELRRDAASGVRDGALSCRAGGFSRLASFGMVMLGTGTSEPNCASSTRNEMGLDVLRIT